MIDDTQYMAWLKKSDVQRCVLVEAKYYDSDEQTAYMASMPYVSRPTDTPANQPYDDVITDTPKFSVAMGDALEGYTVPSWGEILIDNSHFDRDAWLTYGWDGREVKILYGDPAWSRSDFRPILTGTISGISAPSSNQIKMSIKDKQWSLNVPIQNRLVGEPELVSGTTYKVSDASLDYYDADGNLVPGTIYAVWDNGNLVDPSTYTTSPSTSPATFTLDTAPVGILSADYTGGPTSTGDVLPLCYGEAFNVTPKCLSATLFVYQINDWVNYKIIQVRDGGVPVPFTENAAEGKFTLLSPPVGVVTCDVQGVQSGVMFVDGVGRIVRHILLNHTGLTVDDIDHDSLSAFLTTCPQRVGIYINSRRNVLDVLDDLIKSVGGFYVPNRQGKLIFGRIDTPTGTPVIELTADDVVSGGLKIVKQTVPTQTVRLAYLRNYTPQDTTHGSVTDADSALYAAQWQYVTRTNPAIKTAHLLAASPDAKQTCLVDRTEAETEAARLLALNGTVHTTYSAECYVQATTLNVGAIVRLTHHRYGLQDGKLMTVVGITESLINRRVTLTLRD